MSQWIGNAANIDSGVDGSGNPVSATAITGSLIRACPSGDTLLLAVCGGGGKTVSSITDTKANTYTIDQSLTDGTVATSVIARCNLTHSLATTDTITVTFSGANAYHVAVAELYAGTLLPDVGATCTPATSTAPSTAATSSTSHSVETVFGSLAVGGGKTRPSFTPTSPYSTRQSNNQTNVGANTGRDVYSIDCDTSAAGAQTVSGTLSASQPWDIVCQAYNASGGGGSSQSFTAGFATPANGAGSIQVKMIGFGLRGSGPDITGAHGTYPWAKCVSPLDLWSNIEPSDGSISFTGFDASFQDMITNGYTGGIRIEMALDGAPSWIYSANSLGPAVQHLTTYTDPSDTTGARTPVPWDPTLRKMWQRLCTHLQAYLQTSFGGKRYADVCAFVAVSGPTALPGTEMTIGDEGDSRNTAAWNAILSPQSARQAAYRGAWENHTSDALNLISGTPISVASGTVWGDGRAQFMALCDYFASILSPSQFARLIVGPTDLRTDQPGANSYAAWSAAADTAMRHALSLGMRTWGQSAGWSWWGQAFTGGTLKAIQTAYLTDGVGQYQMEMVEANTQILGNVSLLPAWTQSALQPAILAQQWSTPSGGGSTSYGANLSYSSGTAQLIHTGFAGGQPLALGPAFAHGSIIILAGSA